MMGAIDDGKHSLIRYYINNFTDGYNCDCLDLSQGQITAKQNLNSRGFLTPLKLAFTALFASLILTGFYLGSHFPYAEEQVEGGSWDNFKIWIFRCMVYTSVFFVGVLGI